MTERPIIFSAPMVRAILAGTKTQTRRVVKPQPTEGMSLVPNADGTHWMQADSRGFGYRHVGTGSDYRWSSKFGTPGDRLFVRESGSIATDKTAFMYADHGGCLGPTAPAGSEAWAREWKSCPSIHMPRWASRLTLEVVSVRVERLQEISEADAVAEGIPVGSRAPEQPWPLGEVICRTCGKHRSVHVGTNRSCPQGMGTCFSTLSYRGGFASLWDSINAKRHPWASNPFVWVVEFKRLEGGGK